MNVLWIIGWAGSKVCYLNITQEEAEARYLKETGFLDPIEKLEFKDEFGAYNISDGVKVEPITKTED